MSTVTDLPEYLTVEETAKLLRLHPRTVRNRINAGLLPAKQVKGGKSRLIAKSDALAMLEDVRPTQTTTASPIHTLTSIGNNSPTVRHPGLTDRLTTPEGRARAIEMLRRLRETDIDEETDAEAQAQPLIPEPIGFRRWNVETWERLDDDE